MWRNDDSEKYRFDLEVVIHDYQIDIAITWLNHLGIFQSRRKKGYIPVFILCRFN
jgi:hypothetical protein